MLNTVLDDVLPIKKGYENTKSVLTLYSSPLISYILDGTKQLHTKPESESLRSNILPEFVSIPNFDHANFDKEILKTPYTCRNDFHLMQKSMR